MDPKLFQDRVEEVGDLNLRQEMADIQAQDPFDLAQGLPNRAEDPVRDLLKGGTETNHHQGLIENFLQLDTAMILHQDRLTGNFRLNAVDDKNM